MRLALLVGTGARGVLVPPAGAAYEEPPAPTPAPAVVKAQNGSVTFDIPAGSHVAAGEWTDLTWPDETLVAASYRLRREPGAAACGPMRTVNAIPPDGALLFVFDYTGRTRPRFPRRPDRFILPRGEHQPYECAGVGHLLRFRERGRSVQAHVSLGPRAEAAVALRVLDSMRVGD